jgi:hypothetical protein
MTVCPIIAVRAVRQLPRQIYLSVNKALDTQPSIIGGFYTKLRIYFCIALRCYENSMVHIRDGNNIYIPKSIALRCYEETKEIH